MPRAQDTVGRLAGPVLARIAHAGRALFDAMVPPRCGACDGLVGSDGGLCPACWADLPFITPPVCARLGVPLSHDLGPGALSAEALANPPAFDRARAVARYEGSAAALVTRLKFSDRPELARLMGPPMAAAGRDLLTQGATLVPVPSHWTRILSRRFDHAGLIAEAVGRVCALPVDHALLVRARRTRHQVGLPRAARRANVEGAFRVRGPRRADVEGRHFVLVDDVLTTGATAEAAARALSRADAAHVDVLIFARVVTGP